MFSVSQAALRLGECIKTIHRWVARGTLHCTRTVGGHRRISITDIHRLLGVMHRELITESHKKRCVIYARVSGHRQKTAGDLDRQPKVLTQEYQRRFRTSPLVFTDIGSGLNLHRRDLKKILALAQRGTINTVMVTYRDRLARFGTELIESILQDHGVALEILYMQEQRSAEEELVTDMMALIASFSGCVYGLRAGQSRKMLKRQEVQSVTY